MPNALQIKPATSGRKQEERKLFVGMTSKLDTEDEVWPVVACWFKCPQIRALFEPFGIVEDVAVLRNHDQSSKGVACDMLACFFLNSVGCAFVKMDSRAHAQDAIQKLHNSKTMEVSCGIVRKCVISRDVAGRLS